MRSYVIPSTAFCCSKPDCIISDGGGTNLAHSHYAPAPIFCSTLFLTRISFLSPCFFTRSHWWKAYLWYQWLQPRNIPHSSRSLTQQMAFGSFALSSLANMGITCRLLHISDKTPQSILGKRALRNRAPSVVMNIGFLIGIIYFFWSHNTYCAPYTYSYFSFCEWSFIVTNIMFHIHGELREHENLHVLWRWEADLETKWLCILRCR